MKHKKSLYINPWDEFISVDIKRESYELPNQDLGGVSGFKRIWGQDVNWDTLDGYPFQPEDIYVQSVGGLWHKN